MAGNNQSLNSISIPVTVATAGTVTNRAWISSASPTDPDLTNNQASDGGTTLSNPTADLSINKSGPSPALVVQNVAFNYTLSVTNNGPKPFFGTITITDDLPSGLTYNSASSPGNVWSCSAGTIVGPAPVTCTLVVTSGSPLGSGSTTAAITLNVVATGTGSVVNSATVTTTSPNVPDPIGGNNTTPSSGTCATTPTTLSNTAMGNRTVSCNLGTIANGAQRTVTIIARPNTITRGTTLVDTATVTTSTTQPASPGTANDQVVNTTLVNNPTLDLLVNNTDSPDPVTVGFNTVHTLTVQNVGPSDAENVVVTDSLPVAGLNFQSFTISNGSCGTVPAVNAVGGVLVCQIPHLQAGTSETITITMGGVTKGVYTNIVRVASDETGTFDINLTNNRVTENTTVRTRADVQVVSKTPSSASVAVRRPYSWVIKVRNNAGVGLAEADTVKVSDTLPATMELTGTPTIALIAGSIDVGASCTGIATQTTFTCSLGTVSSGGEVDITVPVRNLTVPSGGTSTNTASATTSSQDLVANNSNSGVVTITSSSVAGLVFRDFNNNATSDVGDTGINGITMTLTGTAFDGSAVSKSANTNGSGVFTIAQLPEGTYAVARGTVSETFLTVGTQTAGTSGGTATTPPNITAISLGEAVSATGYNYAFVPQARIGLAKRVLGTPTANADGSITTVLRIIVKNHSLETLNSIAITDAMTGAAPSFGTFVAGGAAAVLTQSKYTINVAPSVVGACAGATPTAAFDGSGTTSVATITSLASTASCEFEFTLRYQPSVPLPGGNYTNQANGGGTGALSGQTPTDASQDGANTDPDSDGNPGNNSVPTPMGAALVADVTTSMTFPATVNAGQTVSGTVLYKNNGPYDAQTTAFTLTLSTGLSGVTFGNLPGGAAASYASGTGIVTFTGMPTTLTNGQIASGNGTTGITVSYTQNSVASSTVASGISTTSNEGANAGPNSANATVGGALIADVTTTLAFPASADAGTAVSGTVTFKNNGPSIASGVTYALTLSTGLTGVSFSNLPAGASASYASGTGIVTLTTMPATLAVNAIASGNGTTGIVINYTQNATASTTVASTIGTTTNQGANVAPDNANLTLTGNLIADVTTTLTFPVSANAGTTVSGTILFQNNGPSVASGVTYTMTLTSGLGGVTFGNLPGGATATYASGTGVVTFAGMPTTLAAGAIASGNGTTQITLSYTQPGTAVSTIASGIGTTTSQGANVALDNASASPGGGLIADVRTQVTFPATVNAGQVVSGSIKFSNNGPSISSGMTYAATLSTGLANVTFGNLPAGASAAYSALTGAVTFTTMPATLASGAAASADGINGITVNYTQNAIANSTVTGTITTTTNEGANIAPNTANATILGALIADVTTSMSFPAQVPPSVTVSGTVTFSNTGPSVASGMTYTLTLATGLSGVVIGNLPGGATATYSSVTGAVTFAGMPATLASGAIASGNGTTGLTVSYTQPTGPATNINSTIGTSTNQGANAAPDNASAQVIGTPIADVTTVLDFPASVDGGQLVNGTVRFQNVGTVTAAGVTYAMTLSRDLADVTFGNLPAGASATYNGVTGVVTFSGMPATLTPNQIASGNGTTGITLQYRQNAVALSTIASTITTTTSQGPNPAPDNASTSVAGQIVADVTVTLAFPTTGGSGQPVTGSVTFRNAGPAPAATVAYTLRLTAGLTGVSFANLPVGATATYNSADGVVTFTGMPTSLASGAQSSSGTSGIGLTFTMPTAGAVTINATISTSTNEGINTLPNTAATTVTSVNTADVTTSLTFPPFVRNGRPVTGVVLFSNLGPARASGVTYALTLSTGLTGVSFGNLPAGATATYDAATGQVTFSGMPATLDRGVIASGDGTSGITVTYTQVAAPRTSSTISSRIGTSTDQGANTAPDVATTTVKAQGADLAAQKSADVAQTFSGDTVTYRVRATNVDTVALAAGGTLTDTPGDGLQVISVACSVAAGNQCLTAPSVAQLLGGAPLPALPASGFYEVLVRARVTAANGTTVTNFGRVGTPPSAPDGDPSNDQAGVTIPVDAYPDLAMRKDAVGEFAPGGTGSYVLTVTNVGRVATKGTSTIVDPLPAGVSFVSAAGPGWSCSANGQTVTCTTTAILLPGAVTQVTVTVTVAATAPSTLTNTATVGTPGDPNASNNSSTVTTTRSPNLRTIKTVSVDSLAPGTTAFYTIAITNVGASPTFSTITMTDTMPNGVVPTSASGPGFTCTITGQVVGCTRATALAPGASVAITIAFAVAVDAPLTPATNRACTKTAGDNVVANDCSTVTTPIGGRREASLRKEATGEFIVGQPGIFRLWVKSRGTIPLIGPITVIDSLPNGLSFGSTPDAGWACTTAGPIVRCTTNGPIAPGDSLPLTIATVVAPEAVGNVSNCASIEVRGLAIAAPNGKSCAAAKPRADYRLRLQLTTPRYDRELGEAPDFVVFVRNIGLSPLKRVLVTNLLPRGFTYVAGSSRRGGTPDRATVAGTRSTALVASAQTSAPVGGSPTGTGGFGTPTEAAGNLAPFADPTGTSSTGITWVVGDMLPGDVVRIDYKASIRAGASYNADNVTQSSAVSASDGLVVTSNTATVPIKLSRGVFDTRGVIAGKVYIDCDCARSAGQSTGDVGIPGVRIFLEDGTAAITDAEGKYSFANIRAGLHVVKVDRATMPSGAQFQALNTRNAGDGGSRFVDLANGELHRADFAEGSRSETVLAAVLARRRTGEPSVAADSARIAAAVATPLTLNAPTPTSAPTAPNAFVPLAVPTLHDGNSNLAVPAVRAPDALFAGPANPLNGRLELSIERTASPADGRGLVPVTVRLFDRDGAPAKGNVAVTLETTAGGWIAGDADRVALGTQVVVTDGVGTFSLVSAASPSVATVRATSSLGAASRALTFTPVPRPFMAMGVLQGRISMSQVDRGGLDLTNAPSSFADPLVDIATTRDSGRVRAGARGAVLMKGQVGTLGLLTLSFDSERDPLRTQFRDQSPDVGFPVFGDAGLREFDAQTQQRLYLRLDRGASFIRYGDFATPPSDERRMLLAYNRSLTGITHHLEGPFGVANSFASQNTSRLAIDELPARGLSGPYLLSNASAVVNSERVELLTRDRNQPSLVLAIRRLTRFEDYTIEPRSGQLMFRQPVASLDANLNPVSVRVTYEVEQGGAAFYTYGSDLRMKLFSALELGAFGVKDENPLDRQTLLGANLTLALGAQTTLFGEGAQTETGTSAALGRAWRAELRHQSSRAELRVFAVRGDSLFANQSSTFAGGRDEYGARFSTLLGSATRFSGEALRTQDARTLGRRDGAMVSIEQRLLRGLTIEGGYRWTDANAVATTAFASGGLTSSLQSGGTVPGQRAGSGFSSVLGSSLTTMAAAQLNVSAAHARLTAKIPGSDRGSLFGEYEWSPTNSDIHRGTVGGDWRLWDRARLYARHEWLTSTRGAYTLGQGTAQQNSVFGVDADYFRSAQIFSEYRTRDAFSGRDAEAAIGLRNRWALGQGLLANTSVERVAPMAGASAGDAIAAAAGLEWVGAALWKSTARLEWRNSATGDDLLGSFGYARKLSRDWTLLMRTLWDERATTQLQGRSQVAFAWRQTDANMVNALVRWENRLDRSDAAGAPKTSSVANVAALLINVAPTPTLILSGRYAAKFARDRSDSSMTETVSQLVMGRATVDLTQRLDLGLIGSIIGDASFGQRDYGLGTELGIVVMKNLRIATGYNLFGFTDKDFASLGYTRRGPYLEFGFKFDESLFGVGTPKAGSKP